MDTFFFITLFSYVLIAGLVGVVGYYLINQYWKKRSVHESGLKQMDLQQSGKSATLTLKLQAYERLMIFCERISIPNLLMRLQASGGKAKDLHLALALAVQQEFEHNTTQQLYVSENLWNIVKLTKDNTIGIIHKIGTEVGDDATTGELTKALYNYLGELGSSPVETAQSAIRQEVKTIL